MSYVKIIGLCVLLVPHLTNTMMSTQVVRHISKVKRLSSSSHQTQRTFMDSAKLFLIVRQKEKVIIERFGKYNRTLGSGLHFKQPFIESPRRIEWGRLGTRIDLRETVHELPKQKVITEDNVEMIIGGLVYYKIDENEAEKAIYEIDNLPNAIEKLAQTTLRNIVGSMHFDRTLTSRDEINKKLCSSLDGATDKWGVNITRVELQEITPPSGIVKAMEQQMTAERERRALVTAAEGTRDALIKKADGEYEATIKIASAKKTAAILEAEGEAESRIKKAVAEAESINEIKKTSGENALDFIKTIEYIRTLPKITEGQNNKLIIVPHEMSALSSMLSVAKEALKK